MATFLAGAILTAQTLNDAFTDSESDTQNTTGTSTSTSYTATLTSGTACGVAFVAPTSGIVDIHNAGFVGNNGVGRSYQSLRLRTGSSIGSGSDVIAVVDENAIAEQTAANYNIAAGRSIRVTGLTPGQSYNVQQMFKVSSGTGTFAWKHLSVIPVAA